MPAPPSSSSCSHFPQAGGLDSQWAHHGHAVAGHGKVAGRASAGDRAAPGSIQAIYDGLAPASKAQVDECLVFIVDKAADAEKRAAAAEMALYAGQTQRYEEMFIRSSAANKETSDVVLFGSDEDVREAYRRFTWSLLESKRDSEIESYPNEWLNAYCNVCTPRPDLHLDGRGNIQGEDEEVRATAGELLAMAIEKRRRSSSTATRR